MKTEFFFDEKENKFYLPDKSKTYESFYQEKKDNKEELKKVITYKENYKLYLSENSKLMKFISKEKQNDIFISNAGQLAFLIGHYGFKKYILLKNGVQTNKTLYSLDFDTIKEVDNYLNEEEYKKVNRPLNNYSNIPLKSLSILYNKYQKYYISTNDNEFILTNERKTFFDKLKDLLRETNFVSICGPKSIGKTTSLLYFQQVYITNSLYINLSYCKKLYEYKNKEELYLVICRELFNCLTFEEVNEVYQFLEKNKFNSLMDLLYKLIIYISDTFEDNFYFFIIDQYKEKIDKNNDIIEKIENLLAYNKNLSFIICNSLNEKDYRKALKLYNKNPTSFFLNYLFVNKLVTVTEKDMINLNLNKEEKELLAQCGNLFQYLYKIQLNKNIKNITAIKKDIIEEIKEEINKYYEVYDSDEIIDNIRNIHSIINKKIPYNKLFDILKIFPLKYFIISIDSKDIFLITDIKKDSKISLIFNFPIIMESLNDILYLNKRLQLDNQTDNCIKFKKDFNEFLWVSRFNYQYEECFIKEKIEINSIVNIKENNQNIYLINYAIENIKVNNDSILITTKEENENDQCFDFDTALLKLVNKIENKYKLYLFEETIKTESKDRLCLILLNTLKYYLTMFFKINLNINIEEVYFSYVFNGESRDNTSINYCKANNINYILYYENERVLEKSEIDDRIISSFFYLQNPNSMIDKTIPLTTLDLNKNIKENDIKNEFDKLDNFLNKKRINKTKKVKELETKINSVTSFDNNIFRKNNYIELLLDEELMENNTSIVGVSYKIDSRTKNLLKEINLNNNELKNFKELIKVFGDNLSILSVEKINNFAWDWIPSFRCAILAIDKYNNKFYFDIKNKVLYRLSDKIELEELNVKSKFYLVIFANSKMIVKK